MRASESRQEAARPSGGTAREERNSRSSPQLARKKAAAEDQEREQPARKGGVGMGVLLGAVTGAFLMGAISSGGLVYLFTRSPAPQAASATAPPAAAPQVEKPTQLAEAPRTSPVSTPSGEQQVKPAEPPSTPAPPTEAEVDKLPVVIPTPATPGQRFSYPLSGLPGTPPKSTFQLLSGPPSLGVDAGGQLVWHPTPSVSGPQEISVRLTYPGGTRERRYRLLVNAAPTQVAVAPGPQSAPPVRPGQPMLPVAGSGLTHGGTLPQKATAGKPYVYPLPSPQGEKYELLEGPAGMSLTDGRLTWSPGPGLARKERVRLRVNGLAQIALWLEVEADQTASLEMGRPGGWVVLPDGVSLVATLPDQGKLVWIDTVTNKLVKSFDLPFKPTAMAYQKNHLILAAEGAARVHVFDLESGAVQKEIKVPEGAVADLACHPDKGFVYATTTTKRIVAINADTGVATATKARGMFLAMDPVKGDSLYSAIQPETHDVLMIRELSRGRFMLSQGVQGANALVAKLAIKGASLQVVGVNSNAATNGYLVRITPDGSRVGVVGGGGYRPPSGAPRGAIPTYGIGLFGTDDISSMAGVVEVGAYPHDLAFHPVLDLGVAEQTAHEKVLHLFNSKSLAKITTIPMAGGGPPAFQPGVTRREIRLLTFGGRGTKILYHNGNNTLYSVPLPLSEADQAALDKRYLH